MIEYRKARQKMGEGGDSTEGELCVIESTEELYEGYFEMLIDLYREELEHWINQNEIINLDLKVR